MEPSPLTRQLPPEVFQPKVVHLYESLFKDDEDDGEKSEGFWREFFLLRPDRPSLKRILDALNPTDLLHLETQTRSLFSTAVAVAKDGRNDSDIHALETLSVFLSCVLSKKYAHPSSAIIALLAGIDNVDAVLTEFVGAMDGIARSGRKPFELRQKAVEVLLAFTAGAHQTTLLTYLIQRDLFPSIMKFIQDCDSAQSIVQPFTLLGLLANYNKFEFQNPYQLRLSDFVNEATIQKIIRCVGATCQKLRGQYVDVQDDIPEAWSLSSTLTMIGLGAIAPGKKPERKKVYDAETVKRMFTELPGVEAAILLATYDFTHVNKLFCINLITLPPEKDGEQPFASYLSLTSYLLHHAYLSSRTTHYSHLSLMVFRLLIEDASICRRICSDDSKTTVRLCRQRQPHLPLVKGERPLAAALLDTMMDGINHNLRRRLDVGLYTLCVGITLRILSYMSRTKTRLAYHWAELFRSLLSLIRFLTTYTADVKDLPNVGTLLDHVVNVLALALSAGESFLPTPAAYDDLFYKVVETGDVLVKFRDNFGLGSRNSNSIDTLVSVSTHYKQMLADGGGGGAKKGRQQLTSLQVAEVIKQGYETLSIQATEGLDRWERFREADERTLLKKMAREAVGDVRLSVEVDV
ncbi:Uncharacterized protein SAPIO_CDS1754 [Scedosporium apiospermum]|uniref:Armadillo-like helical domain-containing protein n=1 Tax=Pseudallescheria apiosperma TaxID=563466 RepID=A0A084GDN4_PSEDA|nr:Uncharacterized protein SAPIO_CDS1754 [Scedosporium apiospermum]KEZ45446.1 Uncharacterized protein SAPIO_CDS1754 [Scedosporium apiospermum]